MQHGLVPDGAVPPDGQRIACIDMHDSVFLHVGARADPDLLMIRADRATEPDAGALFQNDLADQVRVRRDPCVRMDLRRIRAQSIDGHVTSSN